MSGSWMKRWRAGSVLVVLTGLTLVVGLVAFPGTAPNSSAAASPVPGPGITLPAELDWEPEYHGQTLCSPDPKPGTLKLGALLDQTYGKYTKYYKGNACPNGLEHQEGRALDWMVNSANSTEKAKAEAFIAWLLAKGPNGEPGANARRLGILYLVWNNRIWGVYRQNDGWREYSNCLSGSKRSSSYNTSCHRDHIHISLTWDGANAQTSFWDGSAETRGPCQSSFQSRPNGSASNPTTLLDTKSGKGLSQSNCRLAGYTRYTSRSYQLKVPVPKVTGGAVQQIKIKKFQLNAPTALEIKSAGTVSIPQKTKLPTTVSVPLRSDGVITFSMPGGYAQVRAVGMGAGVAPPTISARHASTSVYTHAPVSVTGSSAAVPSGADVALQVLYGSKWVTLSSAKASNGSYALAVPAPGNAGTPKYRSAIVKSGKVYATSRPTEVTVLPAQLDVWKAKTPVKSGKRTKIRGRVFGTPPGANLTIKMKRAGRKYQGVHTGPAPSGYFKKKFAAEEPGKHWFKVVVKSADNESLLKSKRKKVQFR
ncbi:MAG: hypothetical protein K0U64_01570 [Actinomycetia bacterium]|nr:hypothetical protein [Actinomycetes bacterium]